MNDMTTTIAPKSDQLNADDLIGRTMTIRVTKVVITGDEQPVAIHFDGDNGKPYRACKSMRRVLVQVWGPDANNYIGRSMTLYRDDKVMFGGVAVGGIRISHMTDIEKPITLALTATRANRKPFTVQPLKIQDAPRRLTAAEWLATFGEDLNAAMTREEVEAILARETTKKALGSTNETLTARVNALAKAALDRVASPQPVSAIDDEIPF